MLSVRWQFLKKPWVIVGLFLIALISFLAIFFSVKVFGYVRLIQAGEPNPFEKQRREASITSLLAQTPLDHLDATRIESKGDDPRLGNPNAKIRIIEFLDYECPFCQRSAPDVRTFMTRHANDVLLTVRDFPLEALHDHAFQAAVAARCVFSQGNTLAYWRYHDLLFGHQDALEMVDLRSYAANVNADLRAFDECIARRTPEASIRTSIADGTAAGVRGTPTFFINGIRVQGAVDLQTFETIYQQLSAKL